MTRKLMTIHETLYPRDNIDYLYASRKEGGRGLASIKDCLDASIQGLEDYIEKNKENVITAAQNSTDNLRLDRKITIILK